MVKTIHLSINDKLLTNIVCFLWRSPLADRGSKEILATLLAALQNHSWRTDDGLQNDVN